jgi:hypothetical protein
VVWGNDTGQRRERLRTAASKGGKILQIANHIKFFKHFRGALNKRPGGTVIRMCPGNAGCLTFNSEPEREESYTAKANYCKRFLGPAFEST